MEAINGNGPYHIGNWFTEDFRLCEPTAPDWPTGHVGAAKLMEKFSLLVQPNLEILDMVEEGDRVAVRWQLSAIHNDEPYLLAMMAIYRFEGSRISDDWGVLTPGKWT